MTSQLAVAALATVFAGGLAYVFLYPLLSGEKRAEKRQRSIVGTTAAGRIERVSGTSRRDQVAQSLKDLEARQSSAKKVTLETRLLQAGLSWSRTRFALFSVVLALVTAGGLFIASGKPLLAFAGALVGGLGLPRWILGFLKKRRCDKFTKELPIAMDVVVRGIKAGLPLGDCLRIIAAESQEPVRGEFRMIMESQALGLPLGEAVSKLYERVPVPEANFFAIVIAIQQKSGGNLSEALGNLSRVLRERHKMKAKVQAMSMEAKASGAIIGALPFIVTLMVYLSSPSYIELLWTTQAGHFALIASGIWISAGIFVMRQMINFDF